MHLHDKLSNPVAIGVLSSCVLAVPFANDSLALPAILIASLACAWTGFKHQHGLGGLLGGLGIRIFVWTVLGAIFSKGGVRDCRAC